MQKLTKKLPDTPGVYIFRGAKRPNARGARASEILYIGKATSLHTRVASYFRGDLMETRGPIVVGMVEVAKSVDFVETDSVLEALILEAHLIKKHQPPYNTKEKDNKSFNYVVITDEDFPRIMTVRGRNLEAWPPSGWPPSGIKYYFGPFPQGSVLREALKIVRKIFPFRDKCLPATAYRSNGAVRPARHCTSLHNRSRRAMAGGRWPAGKVEQGKPCFSAQIGFCPGVCAGTIPKAEYAKTIQRIKLFFEGRKKTLISGLERDMKQAAKALKFEEANRIKKMLFALNHIQDVALLKYVPAPSSNVREAVSVVSCSHCFRIEAYDVAHISGTNTVGVMVVVEDGEPKKSDYRKFKIKTSTNDDNASLREMLDRRFAHSEWPMPKLIVVDGGKTQVNTAEKALKEWGIGIPVVGVVKDERHKPKGFLGDKTVIGTHDRAILLANSEAHRFAVGYHRTVRGKLK